MAWKGSGDNHIWYSFFEPNSGWRPQEVVPHVGGSDWLGTSGTCNKWHDLF
jgi:hypothetical protein